MKKSVHKKIVITGAAGFIGFHLAKEFLEQGWSVVGVDMLTSYYDPKIKQKRIALLKKYPTFSFHKINIAKFDAILRMLAHEKPDELVHLAAQPGVRYSLTNPWAYIECNELATLNIFEAAKKLSIPRVVYASSSSVYGRTEKSVMSEDDRTDSQISVYAATKKANEALAYSYNHLYGIETIGLRFFTVYGTWYRPDQALFKFTKSIFSGESIDVYNRGKMKRSFTHVSDIVSGITAILQKKPHGKNEIYNLGGAESVTLLEFIGMLEQAIGKKAKRNLLPMQPGDVRETVADWSKAHTHFGFTPKTPIREGIAEFVEWFRENETFLKSLQQPKQ